MANKTIFHEGAKFGVVGVISTILDFLFLNLSLTFGATVFWATFIGYAVGTLNGYYFNNHWTYAHLNQKSHAKALTKYAVISAVGLLLTEVIVNYLHQRMGLAVNVAKIIAVIIVFFWNFFVNRLWTFRAQKETP